MSCECVFEGDLFLKIAPQTSLGLLSDCSQFKQAEKEDRVRYNTMQIFYLNAVRNIRKSMKDILSIKNHPTYFSKVLLSMHAVELAKMKEGMTVV